MADFRKLAIDLVAAEGKVNRGEIKILKKALYADDRIDLDEVQFLADLRTAVAKNAKKKTPTALNKFFLKAIQDHVLQNGAVSAEEVALIQSHVLGDKKLAKGAKGMVESLKKKATTTSPELETLLTELTKKKKKK